MSPSELVRATLAGAATPRPPYGFWTHYPGADLDPDAIVRETVAFARASREQRYGYATLLVTATEDWGVRPDFSEIAGGGAAKVAATPITTPQDWARIRRLDPAAGALGRELRHLALLVEALGPDVPVLLTLDPHGNVSDRLAAQVNGISAYRTHPHTDHFETGQRAAAMLARALAEGALPAVHLARRPMLRGFDSCRTEAGPGPMHEALALARAEEAADPALYEVSIQSGFGLADSRHTGPTACVTAARRDARHQAAAERMMDFAWANRERETFRLLSVEEAMEAARNAPPGPGPIVMSDYGDAPGGGAYGDATALLVALLDSGLPKIVFAGLKDAAAAAAAHAAGVGAKLTRDLGGHTDPRCGGGPVRLAVEVLALSEGTYINDGPYAKGQRGTLGPSALLAAGNVRIFVNTHARNVLDPAQLRLVGLGAADCGVLAVKGMDATRAAFQPGSRAFIPLESGGIASRRGGRLPYRNLRRPIWPLDPIGDC